MPLIEVEEAEYRQRDVAKALLDKLYNSPKTRAQFLGMIKEHNPDASIPELDVTAPLQKEFDTFRKEVGGTIGELKALLEASKQEKEVDTLIESERRKLRKAGWDDDGIAQVEKVMQDRGVVDYEMAAAYVERNMKKPEAADDTFSMTDSWNIGTAADEDEAHKGWLRDPIAQSRKEISKFFADKRAGRLSA